jgi:kynurenine formamidase
MRIQTFVIGMVLALAIFLFAQNRHAGDAGASGSATVIDLTHAVSPADASHEKVQPSVYNVQNVALSDKSMRHNLPGYSFTGLEAPSEFAKGMWTVDSIPAERLVAPLVVLNVSKQAALTPDYQVSMHDVANWEQAHGDIPMGSIVLAYTGWGARGNSTKTSFPGYSLAAAQFLIEAREIVGLGLDTPRVDRGLSSSFPVRDFILSHSVYQLNNVANLAIVPPRGATAVVAPAKLANAAVAPVRILALVRNSGANPQPAN